MLLPVWAFAFGRTSSKQHKQRRCRRFYRPKVELLEPRLTPTGPPTDNIQAFVFVDSNWNGMPDPGEQPVPGVSITLNVNGSNELTLNTDSNGRAWFGPGWGTNAQIVLTMAPTADTGDGTPYHYWNSAFSPDYVSISTNKFTFTNISERNMGSIPEDYGTADYDRNTFLDTNEGFYFGIKPQHKLVVTAQPTTGVLNGDEFDVKVSAESLTAA